VNAWSADRLDHAIELTITLVDIRRGGFIFTDNFKLLSKNITVDHGGILEKRFSNFCYSPTFALCTIGDSDSFLAAFAMLNISAFFRKN